MAKLIYSGHVRRALDSYNATDYLSAISALFEILDDPEPDGIKKIQAGGFPFQTGVVEAFMSGWYISYQVVGDGDVRALRIMRESELPPKYPG